MSEPEPNALAQPKERATLTPAQFPSALDHPRVTIVDAPLPISGPAPTAEPPPFAVNEPWMMIPKVEGPPLVETCLDPVVYLEPCGPQRGESPMMRNWKMLTMYSLMTAATMTLAPTPTFAGEPNEPNEELKKSIDKLIKRIGSLETDTLAEIKKSLDQASTDIGSVLAEQRKQKKQIDDQKYLIDLLSMRIDSLEKKIFAANGSPAPAVDKAFMEEFRTTMRTLNETLAKMGPTRERVSMASPNGNGTSNLGRVMLANHFHDELLFIVNGVGHRLAARSTKLVELPAGPLSYEVFSTRFGVLERRATNLAGGHTFNLAAQ